MPLRISYAEAVALQGRLRRRLSTGRDLDGLALVAGVDVSVKEDRASAAIAVLSFPDLEPVETVTAVRPVEFPYIPGLLAFREVPVIVDAFRRLEVRPDLLLVDGHGYAHPRRFGVACHVGVELSLPSIGCGKTLFVGTHREPGLARGSRAVLKHEGEIIGYALRTREGVKPVYVSIGHRVDLETARRLLLRCCGRYRLPEPIRAAHRAAGEAVRKE